VIKLVTHLDPHLLETLHGSAFAITHVSLAPVTKSPSTSGRPLTAHAGRIQQNNQTANTEPQCILCSEPESLELCTGAASPHGLWCVEAPPPGTSGQRHGGPDVIVGSF
jgi:hypothetical protein